MLSLYNLDKITNQQGTASNNAQAIRHLRGKRSDTKYKSDRIDISIGYVSFAMYAAKSGERDVADKSRHCKIGEKYIG